MSLYRLLPGVRKNEARTAVWFGGKVIAIRAYNQAIRDAEADPSKFSGTTITLEEVLLEESAAKVLAAVMNGQEWNYSTSVMHTHKVIDG